MKFGLYWQMGEDLWNRGRRTDGRRSTAILVSANEQFN